MCLSRARSSIIKTSTSPEWNERIIAPVADKVSHIRLTVKDNNQFTAPPIGHARIPVAEIAPGKKFDAWVDLLDDQEEVVSKKDPLRQHSKVISLCWAACLYPRQRDKVVSKKDPLRQHSKVRLACCAQTPVTMAKTMMVSKTDPLRQHSKVSSCCWSACV